MMFQALQMEKHGNTLEVGTESVYICLINQFIVIFDMLSPLPDYIHVKTCNARF